ncbi:MAG: hypothetical protein JKY48_03355 [Flavobacteriales bacterium]|nr:hypothetical protein [Flavobacteriales bacterium]
MSIYKKHITYNFSKENSPILAGNIILGLGPSDSWPNSVVSYFDGNLIKAFFYWDDAHNQFALTGDIKYNVYINRALIDSQDKSGTDWRSVEKPVGTTGTVNFTYIHEVVFPLTGLAILESDIINISVDLSATNLTDGAYVSASLLQEYTTADDGKKISELPSLGAVTPSTEFPAIDGGVTYRVNSSLVGLDKLNVGMVSMSGNDIPTNLPVTSQWEDIGGETSFGDVYRGVQSTGKNSLDITENTSNSVEFFANLSGISGDPLITNPVEFGVFKNGSLIPESICTLSLSADDDSSISLFGFSSSSSSDSFEIKARCTLSNHSFIVKNSFFKLSGIS